MQSVVKRFHIQSHANFELNLVKNIQKMIIRKSQLLIEISKDLSQMRIIERFVEHHMILIYEKRLWNLVRSICLVFHDLKLWSEDLTFTKINMKST